MIKIFKFVLDNFFYILIAYLPFGIALNIGADYDLASVRILILFFFIFWLWTFLKQKKQLVFDARLVWPLAFFLCLAGLSIFWSIDRGWALRKILFLFSIAPVFLLVQCCSPSSDEEGAGGGVDINRKNHPSLPFLSTEGREKAAFCSEHIRFDISKFWLAVIFPAVVSALIALAQFLAQFIFGLDPIIKFWAQHIAPIFWGQNFGALVAANPSWLVEINGQTLMRAVGLFPDPHMLAFYLGLILPLVFVGVLFSQEYKKTLLAVFCLLFVVFCLTFSRGGYFGLIFSLSLVLIKSWPRLSRVVRKFMLACLVVGLLAAVFFGSPAIARFVSSFDLAEGSNSGRLANWSQSLAVFEASPLLGVGLGSYSLAVNPTADYRNSISSHNLYLDILAELGIFGLAAWLLIWLALARGFYVLKIRKENSFFLLGIYGGLIYFAVHSFFETAMFNPTVFAFLMVYLGLISNLKVQNSKP